MVDAQAADHVDQRPQLVRGEALDQPEVQKRDLAAAIEQVVARMRGAPASRSIRPDAAA